MANDKKKINELVSEDDDPTAELELPVLQLEGLPVDASHESDADTSGLDDSLRRGLGRSMSELRSDLQARTETIERLQFDIEQLHSKWQGLETEISAREEITKTLNSEVDELRSILARKKDLLKKRDKTIKSLKGEIRDRHDEQHDLHSTVVGLREKIEQAHAAEQLADVDGLNETIAAQDQRIQALENDNAALTQLLDANADDTLHENRRVIAEQAGQLASKELLVEEMRAQAERSESYADSIRRQLQESQESLVATDSEREGLQESLDRARDKVAELSSELERQTAEAGSLGEQLENINDRHAKEIRIIRFELGEAQETATEHAEICTQLAADLVETRGFREQLEGMLDEAEANNKAIIEKLEKDNMRLLRAEKGLNEQLDAKNNTINCLIAELTKKSQQIESIGEIEDVIQEIDVRMSERIDEKPVLDRDRVTRVLIGSVEGQELRFPLFKDRLTIGRTEKNDIQLKAAYISRRHAVIVTEGTATRVVDWGSKNGVFVNSRRVKEHFLRNRDIVAIGTAKFRYEERPKRDV